MYKKHCLITSILLIMPLFTIAMEVENYDAAEQKEQKWIYIETNDCKTFGISPNSKLFSQSSFFEKIIEGKFVEKGTADNPIKLRSIDSDRLKFICKFIKRKRYPKNKELKQYLQNCNINDLNKLIAVGSFFDIKGISKSIVPFIVKQLQDSNILDAWLKSGGDNVFDKNKALSDPIKRYLVRKIKPTPQYLQQRKSIPFDVLKEHNGWVKSVVFNPDCTMLASGSNDKKVKVWDVKTGIEIRTLIGHKDCVYSVAFSPNGKKIASGSKDKEVKVWNVKTGIEIRTLIGHKDCVHSVVFSPNGKKIASASDDDTIKVWNATTGKRMHTFYTDYENSLFTACYTHCNSNNRLSVGFSPDGILFASGLIKYLSLGKGGRLRYYDVELWNIETGGSAISLTEYNKHCSSRFSQDSTMFASISGNKTIKFWNLKTGCKICTLPGDCKICSVRFSPDSTMFVTGLLNGIIKIWRLINVQDKAIKQLSILDLLLINTCQPSGIIDLHKTNPELYQRYKKASKLVKSLIPQQEKS